MIHAKKLPKTSMKNLRRKAKFKRPAEKEENSMIKVEQLRKDLKRYTEGKN
ncbi:hypothetical protein [Peptoniphilus asaccharolyticus]|uniref:hypothetical protein n=1 Tax=Peptoniphilus asaccharolyticus TaxID=1258 RepID=UPI00399B4B6A